MMRNMQKTKKVIAILLLLLLLFSRIYPINAKIIEKNLSIYNIHFFSHNIEPFLSPPFPFPVNSCLKDYVIHSPISILCDEDWEKYAFSGSGIKDDPYIIEGYNITTHKPYGIIIANTTKHFTIQYCYIKSASGSTIFISNVSSGTVAIQYNILESNHAIYVEYSPYSTIVENTCFKGGISVSYSNDTFISGNICEKGGGISIGHSHDIIVSSNYCANSWEIRCGIMVARSTNILIINNNVSSNEYGGIYCINSEDITVKGNFCWNNSYLGGIYFSNVTKSSVLDNIYINNLQENICIRNCTAIKIANNICANTQRFYHCFGDILGWGILITSGIDEDCKDIIIEQNECVNNTYGIALLHCNGTIIVRNNYIQNCYKAGITLYNLNNSVITYNTLFSNPYGVYIEYDAYEDVWGFVEDICYNNLIHHNNFIENNLGGSSQAYDAGINNTWYDPSTFEGNYWSDAIKHTIPALSIPYAIDGPAGSFDLYPLHSPVSYFPPSYSHFSLFHYWWFDLSLLLSSVLLFSLLLFFRRWKIFCH